MSIPVASLLPRLRRSRAVRLACSFLGLALLGLAIWSALARGGGGDLRAALSTVVHGGPFPPLALLALPLTNWLLISATFWVLTRRLGPVSFAEMAGLIGSAWLLNFLPLRPGLLGRLAYHRVVHHIPLRASAGVVVLSMVAGAAAVFALGAGIATLPRGAVHPSAARLALTLAAPVVVLAVAVALARGRPAVRSLLAAGALRYLDLGVWAARYALAFWLVGRPLALTGAAAVAAAGQVGALLPVQLGAREWVEALVAGWLPADAWQPAPGPTTAPAVDPVLTTALAAVLLNRAAEVAAAVPVGLISTAWLYRRTRAAASVPTPDRESGPTPAVPVSSSPFSVDNGRGSLTDRQPSDTPERTDR